MPTKRSAKSQPPDLRQILGIPKARTHTRDSDSRWLAGVWLWQLRRLWAGGSGKGGNSSHAWALIILVAANREQWLAYSAPHRRRGRWVSVGRALLPGIAMPAPESKGRALELLRRVGLIEVHRPGERNVPWIRGRNRREVNAWEKRRANSRRQAAPGRHSDEVTAGELVGVP